MGRSFLRKGEAWRRGSVGWDGGNGLREEGLVGW
jgi:hypothetical protein